MFTVSDNTFKNATNYPYNNHFYQFGYDGIGNLTYRRYSEDHQFQVTSSFVSKGHFLDAPYYVETVNRRVGIREPDRSTDDQYFDVEPRTGLVLHRHLSYMASITAMPLMYRSYDHYWKNITNQLVPLYECTVDGEATNHNYNTLKKKIKCN